MKKTTKRIIIVSLLSAITIISAPLSLLCVDCCIKDPYEETYYGEFIAMVDRLKEAEGKKIVFLGNSAVAFGVDSDLIERELAYAGLDYACCNFGLYGSIGTGAMMDFSLPCLNEGDIVILLPEEYPQAMSDYYSASEVWRAISGRKSLLNDLPSERKKTLLATYPEYVAEKRRYEGLDASSLGVYRKESFDERCDMKNAERVQNAMGSDAYDVDTPIVLFKDFLYDDGYVDLVNEYVASCGEKGAHVFYGFAPMNELAVKGSEFASFVAGLQDDIEAKIIMDPGDAVMDERWFFDSNFHLNSAGSSEYSLTLTDAIKNEFGISLSNQTSHPSMPELPEISSMEGDDSDAGYFEYEEKGDGYQIVSINGEGKMKEDIVIPATYNGKPVRGFDAGVFADDFMLKSIKIQNNVTRLRDQCFSDCANLEKIILTQTNPEALSVGFSLLEGADKAYIYVKESSLSAYTMNYFWGHYRERYITYEG